MSSMSRLVWVLLGLWVLGLPPAYGQEKKPPEKPWTGKLADGRAITEAVLNNIVLENKLWIESEGKEGKKANLEEANLSRADLRGADLRRVHINGANLSRADLRGANLSRALLNGANLSEARLMEAKLSGADLSGAKLSGASLRRADLSLAQLYGANLSQASLIKANLSGAILSEADLTGAHLSEADLSRTWLVEANLSGVILRRADLKGARFEPKPGLPGANQLLYLKGLDSLQYIGTSSYGLMELREIYKKAGMRDEERQVTYALGHNRRLNAWAEIEEKIREGKISWTTREIARFGNIFHLVFFEWTCDYGMTPSRPLIIMFAGLFVFTFPYLLALRSRDPETGIWAILPPDRVLDRKMQDRPFKLTFRLPSPPFPEKRGYRFRGKLWRGWRGLRLAFFFSLLSAFNIGWREINVGNWISRIQK